MADIDIELAEQRERNVLSYSVRTMADALVARINRRIANGRASREDKTLLDTIIPFLEDPEGWSGPDDEERAFWEPHWDPYLSNPKQ